MGLTGTTGLTFYRSPFSPVRATSDLRHHALGPLDSPGTIHNKDSTSCRLRASVSVAGRMRPMFGRLPRATMSGSTTGSGIVVAFARRQALE